MAQIIEFLLVFLLTLSLIFLLVLSFNSILTKTKSLFLYSVNSKSLENFSLFAGLSYCYSSSVSFPYSYKNKIFTISYNKIQANMLSMDSIAEINLGGFIVKSEKIPT